MKKFCYFLIVFWIVFIYFATYMLVIGEISLKYFSLELLTAVCNLYLPIFNVRKKTNASDCN